MLLCSQMDMMRSQLHTLADGRHSHEQQLQTQVGEGLCKTPG